MPGFPGFGPGLFREGVMGKWLLVLVWLQAGKDEYRMFEFAQLPTCNASQAQYIEDITHRADTRLLVAECLPVGPR